MFTIIIFLLIGFALLIKGADIMVEGSSSIAKKFGVSSFVIGLTVVAFGTSAPELIVSALASFKGSEGIAMGNIIGSNISNTLLILGVSAMISPLLIKKATVNKEIPFSLLAVTAVGLLVNDFIIDYSFPSILSRADGYILILFFVIFMYYTFGIRKVSIVEGVKEKLSGEIKEKSTFTSVGMIILGLAGLGIGGKLIVDSGVQIAALFGMSEALVGLTIIAIGTSLPELAASAMSAYKGKADMAMGNVVGSNIFNLLWVLGISSVIRPITFNPLLNTDFLVLFFITILLIFLIFVGKKHILSKIEGSVLLSIYFVYMIFLVIRG